MSELTPAQERLLERLRRQPDGVLFISGSELLSARALERRGYGELGTRNPETGERVPGYTTKWAWALEIPRTQTGP